jgi:LmeA-like phospholipid-binding
VLEQNRSLGEQAIDKVAEIAIASRLDGSESFSVTVNTDPGQLAQGEVEAVNVEGKGLVMQQDLRVQELEIHVKDITVNPLSAMFGKIELNGPAFGTARAVLTESDINRAFNSEYISMKLNNLQVSVDGKPLTIDVKTVECKLLSSGKIDLNAEVLVRETAATEKIHFTAKPQVAADGWAISLEDVEYPENKEFSPELTAALADKAGEILNLRNFELEGMSLRIQQLNVEAGLLTLQAEAKVEQFPS